MKSLVYNNVVGVIRTSLFFLLFFVPGASWAQYTYTYDNGIKVVNSNGDTLAHAWAGGINSAQINTFDLNGDGRDDLVIYDRTAERFLTFLNVENASYRYAPDYEAIFPTGVMRFVLLKDFDCDGRKDIFSSHEFGIQVFRNISEPGGSWQWEQVMFPGAGGPVPYLLTKGFTGMVNLQMRYDDLPAIEDMDGDGDLDIMNTRFVGAGSVEYHKNFSMERYGNCSILEFERQSQQWGGFTQCFCEDFAFHGDECNTSSSVGKIQHGAGKGLLAIDLNNDGNKDILYSESECDNIFFLLNKGTIDAPVFDEVAYFPTAEPIAMTVFPMGYWEDVDFDGVKDLVVSPNLYQREFYQQDLQASMWLLKNSGTNAAPSFGLQTKSFMQRGMIEVGDNSVPSFFDYDDDGDLDMFVGYNADTQNRGAVVFYENVGSSIGPVFQYRTDNFLNFKSLLLKNIKLQFVDITGDGVKDLTFMATDPSINRSKAYYIPNTNGISLSNVRDLDISIAGVNNIHFADVNGDGLADALVGASDGSLQYFRNSGGRNSPSFTLQNGAFLGLGTSPTRQNIACTTGDLNADGRLDLVYSDYTGKIMIVDNFLDPNAATQPHLTEILYNPLLGTYRQPVAGGLVWPVVANILGVERPQIVLGSILGGLRVLVNEGLAGEFEELLLSVYPNPSLDGEVNIQSNLSAVCTVFSTTGGQAMGPFNVVANTRNRIDISGLAAGVYIMRFSVDGNIVSRRLVVLK